MSTKNINLILAFLLLVCLIQGCNTLEGVGEDIEAVGEKIDKEAEENKSY